MLAHLRSNVVAYVALCVALGGTSYAAVSLPAKSVGKKQLKKGAVTSKKVKNGSLKALDFRAGQLPGGERGPQGAQGPRGPQGPKGDAGAPGPVWGSAAMDDFAQDPGLNPDGQPHGTYEFTLPRSGPVYIQFAHDGLYATCTAGFGEIGLYLDGTPVPNTANGVNSSSRDAVTLVTVVDLPAGEHTVVAQTNCPEGNFVGFSGGFRGAWTVFLLGDS